MKNLLSPLLIIATLTIWVIPFQKLGAQNNSGLADFVKDTCYDAQGHIIFGISFPEIRPGRFQMPPVELKRLKSGSDVYLSQVPAFDWVYGCAPTSAAMMAGYYDNTGYPDIYTGPENGGVAPMDNLSVWGAGESPLSATKIGLDGRTVKGYFEDYWRDIHNNDPDPYIGNWTEHEHADCTGDFMGTSQSKYNNPDGATQFYYSYQGYAVIDHVPSASDKIDGCHGLKEFFESRGYQIVDNYNQLIYGYDPDGSETEYQANTHGFTFDQFKQEIDNGRPVMIHLTGHTMLGFGYNALANKIFIHDTWDYQDHEMTWGGEYSSNDLQHCAVTVFQLVTVNNFKPPLNLSASVNGLDVTLA